MSHDRKPKRKLSRRQLVCGAALSTVVASATSRAAAMPELEVACLRETGRLAGRPLSEERLRELAPSIEKNQQDLEFLRQLELDDQVEPATCFRVKG